MHKKVATRSRLFLFLELYAPGGPYHLLRQIVDHIGEPFVERVPLFAPDDVVHLCFGFSHELNLNLWTFSKAGVPELNVADAQPINPGNKVTDDKLRVFGF